MEDKEKCEQPSLPVNYGKLLAPVSSVERIVSMDVLRGIALLGILIANMQIFSQPAENSGFRDGLWLGWGDRMADWITIFLVEGKFYPLFSFLFGLGFSVQMERALSHGLDFRAKYRRRLFILMGFGLAHGIFIWQGDILLTYAVCGFFLVLFRERKSRTIAVWAAFLLFIPAVLILAGGLLILWLLGIPAISKAVQESFTQDSVATRRLIEAFVTGGYADAVVYRLGELVWVILASVIVLLIDQRPSLPFLPPLATVGRMALTNYLGQSLIATTLFYGYGSGLTGSVGKLGTIGIAVLIFAAQILFSVLRLRSFRYGPMEWLWRSFTYGVRQPMGREHQLTR